MRGRYKNMRSNTLNLHIYLSILMSNYDKRESANDNSKVITIYPKFGQYLLFFFLILPLFFISLVPILHIRSVFHGIHIIGFFFICLIYLIFPLLFLTSFCKSLFFTKVQFHDTFIHLKGFTHSIFRHRIITNINYSDIVEANKMVISSGGSYTVKLLIKKIDGTTISFDISRLNYNKVFMLLHQHMVNQLIANPANETPSFSINIENKPGSFWTGRNGKLDIYINNADKLNIVTSNITLDVHVGDILTLKEEVRTKIFRIQDYSRTTYNIQET